jgi:hypothetical protein
VVLIGSPDPVVRTALAEAARHRLPDRPDVVARLRSDPVAVVRLLALVAAFDRDDPAAWPDLDAAIRAELDECAGVLGVPGRPFSQSAAQNWSRALTGLDREQDCCTWVERLTDRSETAEIKLEGVRMSSAAMRAWRAAPARLTPALPRSRNSSPGSTGPRTTYRTGRCTSWAGSARRPRMRYRRSGSTRCRPR